MDRNKLLRTLVKNSAYQSTGETAHLELADCTTISIEVAIYVLHKAPLPVTLPRDQLWGRQTTRPQLEFVVDNLTLANIANGHARITNEFYAAALGRIQGRLRRLFQWSFDYKATLSDPVDWRLNQQIYVA